MRLLHLIIPGVMMMMMMNRIKCFSDVKSTTEKQQHVMITFWNEKIAPFWSYRDITPHSDMKIKDNLCFIQMYCVQSCV